MDKVTGTTKSGFPYEIEADIFDDWETVDIMRRVHAGENFAVFDLIDRILGPEQKERLKAHLRTESGRVPISAVNDEILEIMAAMGNSQSSPG